MAGFFNKLKSGSGTGTSDPNAKASPNKKKEKEEPPPELTPLEKMLQNAGPLRGDGSDKFFGLENFGNTCYCNSIVQALYYSESFRQNVVNYPSFSPSDTPNGTRPKVNVQIRPPMNGNTPAPGQKQKTSGKDTLAQRKTINAGQIPPGQPGNRPEDKPDSPEYKKKQAMIKGPVLELAQENASAYGMQECTFTGLKDIFMAMIESNSRTGVLSPQRFLEIFKRDNETFRSANHQDAHEFYGLVLNDVISNVETNARRLQEKEESRNKDGLAKSVQNALGAATAIMKGLSATGTRSPGTGWVHDIFEGVLTSETKCLTCETTSQRDETFLDLSIDLEEHSSVTSCLRKFSAEEMLCERNKFHCDHCGGLQEAEKRMKLKRLPKVLALHLKRFKYTEDYSRLQKLFHRVVYPYHLRMFNTTDDADDPDRMYELYAVVVHIGGNAYHGHYVSVIKTPDRGWVLFDDEMVEPVDKHFVRNFFGDKPGMASAYVLFYQETTFEKVLAQQEADGLEEVMLASQKAGLALEPGRQGVASLSKLNTAQPASPVTDDHDALASLDHAHTAPGSVASPVVPTAPPGSSPAPATVPSPAQAAPAQTQAQTQPQSQPSVPAAPAGFNHPLVAAPPPAPAVVTQADLAGKPEGALVKTKEEKAKEKKEAKAAEKARKAAEKEAAKEDEKRRKERSSRWRESRKAEEDEMKKAIEASMQSASKEEERRKAEEAPAGGTLGRSSTKKRAFGFLSGKDKDKDRRSESPAPGAPAAAAAVQNGSGSGHPLPPLPPPPPVPEKDGKVKGRLSFGIGKRKSSGAIS